MAFIEPCLGIGHNLSLICQMTSEDIKHQLIIGKVTREAEPQGFKCLRNTAHNYLDGGSNLSVQFLFLSSITHFVMIQF